MASISSCFLQTGDLKWSKQFWTWNITYLNVQEKYSPEITPNDYTSWLSQIVPLQDGNGGVCAPCHSMCKTCYLAEGWWHGLRMPQVCCWQVKKLGRTGSTWTLQQASDSIELLFKCSDIYQISLAQSLWHGNVSCWEKASTIYYYIISYHIISYHIIIFKYEEYATSRWRARSSA